MKNQILVETSARHVHLTQEHIEVLFGAGHQLTVKKMLSQPGQFASMERVEVVGPEKVHSECQYPRTGTQCGPGGGFIYRCTHARYHSTRA